MDLPKNLVIKNHFELDTLIALCVLFHESAVIIAGKEVPGRWDFVLSHKEKLSLLTTFLKDSGEPIHRGIHLKERKTADLEEMIELDILFLQSQKRCMIPFEYCFAFIAKARCGSIQDVALQDIIEHVKKEHFDI